MFGSIFKKREPTYRLQEQLKTRVLLLPEKFKDNEITRQAFSVEERFQLMELFEERGADYRNYGDSVVKPVFSAHILNMGEKFFSDHNDLNQIAGEVREFEFFSSR
jgi:hypothetical protein